MSSLQNANCARQRRTHAKAPPIGRGIGMEGPWNVRLALLLGMMGPGWEYRRFLVHGLYSGAWYGEFGHFFVLPALFAGLALSVSFLAIWWLGYPAIRLVALVTHR